MFTIYYYYARRSAIEPNKIKLTMFYLGLLVFANSHSAIFCLK